MRSYCALYVDVGYLLAAAATRVTGTSLRNGVVVSYPDLVARLIADAEQASGLPLLRLHWYDSGNRRAGKPHAVSRHLIRESDDLIVLDGSVIDETVHVRQLQPETEVAVSAAAAGVVVPLPGPRATPNEPSTAAVAEAPPPPAAAAPARPTPAVLAGSKVPQRPVAAPGAPGRLVWSSDSAGSGDRPASAAVIGERELQAIDDVCRGVIATWSITASAADRTRLMSQKPFIPGDLDRALLLDLSARLDRYDVEDQLRFVLVKDNHVRKEPPLASLVVHKDDGQVGAAYDEVRSGAGESPASDPLEPENRAAAARLECYRHWGADVPADAQPTLSARARVVRARTPAVRRVHVEERRGE